MRTIKQQSIAKKSGYARKKHTLCFVATACLFFTQLVAQPANNLPYLATKGHTKQLVVDGRPFLVLGGESGNSSASDLAYMQPVWSKLKTMHLNTVLIPVYWELMEPVEGRFDFRLVDSLVYTARKNKLKVILLWFGSWKNSMSCYAPAWVKTNQARFPRAQDHTGKGLEILSAFSDNNVNADIAAFTALMTHLKQTDKAKTVIMMQVENEMGMLTEARERTPVADEKFRSEVPAELVKYLQKNKDSILPEIKEHWSKNGFALSGNWETVFGKSLATEEVFQAWHYARYAEAVAAAGKKAYPIPMFVNAALNHRHVQPGQYPSGGPLPHLLDLWHAAAPSIDILSPDFYNPDFKYYNDLYTRQNNPLFIPEIRLGPDDAAKVFYAFGHYQAIGFSPFSIESVIKPGEEPIGKSYAVLSQLAPDILKYQGTGQMEGVLLDTAIKSVQLKMGNYTLTVSHDYTLGWSPEAAQPAWPMAGGIIIQDGQDSFIIAGTGIVVTFAVKGQSKTNAGILAAEEGAYHNGKWVPGRRMNGDQDHQGRHIRIAAGEWGIQKVKLYQYQ